jgi:gelsolin
LDPDDIMVLDGGDEIYVWVGTGSTDEEKAKSSEMAMVKDWQTTKD